MEILKSSLYLLVLLNPFLVVVYLIEVMEKLPFSQFKNILLRAGLLSYIVFTLFAIIGDTIFQNIIQAEFASFQIFGGIVFLLIGIQFVFKGGSAIEGLRGESRQIAGAIAMPILIGPGTISFSVIIGKRLNKVDSALAIFIALFISISVMIILKKLHDGIHEKKEDLLGRYYEIAGRIIAMVVGTIAIEMIMKGVLFWMGKI
ncbi:MAG: MarC family protein [Bacteroidota bacterium]